MISILIIGNEILAAAVQDTNLIHMLRVLNVRGYKIDEVRIVPDDIERIAEAVRELSKRSTFVISSGGVGPTHDDVTMAAYARAFEVKQVRHQELAQRLNAFYKDQPTAEQLRMADVPENAQLVSSDNYHWPVVQVANCFVLPGLPAVFLKKFDTVLEQLPESNPFLYGYVTSNHDEASFSTSLKNLQARYPTIEMGSYPIWEDGHYEVKVTVKGRDPAQIHACFKDLQTLFEKLKALKSRAAPAPFKPFSET